MPDSAHRSCPDESLDNLIGQLRAQSPAHPKPFFYARVQSRLAAKAVRPLLPAWLRRPAYAVQLVALVLSLSGDRAAADTAYSGAQSMSGLQR